MVEDVTKVLACDCLLSSARGYDQKLRFFLKKKLRMLDKAANNISWR